jgi:demethylmenaquinone methyltransferase/2-methoxy-6-polyprenyl-1,4-benzoquinol methylase
MLKFNHFSVLAPVYEKYISPIVPEKLISLANLPVHGKILDVGGGTGRVSQFLSPYADLVFLADQSYPMTQESGKKVSLIPVCTESESLPFPSNTFDRIIMVDALHHVNQQEHTLNELWRITKPGGILIIEEPDIHTLYVKLIALAEKLALMRSHFLAPETIANHFRKLPGMVSIERQESTAWVVVKKN